jgi:EAL domain-containing protein (putative c-di-GMP-specific phosphodiesterase class I)
MSSSPQLKEVEAGGGAIPFASYGQLLRMLMPAVHRVGFYDPRGRTLWVSEGVEEPEFRMHLDLVLARFALQRQDHEGAEAYSATDQPEPIYIFPIRDSKQTLLGALGLLCRELPATAAYRRSDHVEHLLRPLLDIISHGWRAHIQGGVPMAPESKVATLAPPTAKPDADTPLPAVLRRTLALATRSMNCAFGAIVAVEKAFTLNHRVSPDESDLAINSAIDGVRAGVLKYMRVRNEPLMSNAIGAGRSHQLPYKVLALPLRAGPSRLAAVLIIFRDKNGPDFGAADIESLAQITGQIPPTLLAELLQQHTAASEAAAAPVVPPRVASAPAAIPASIDKPKDSASARPVAAPLVPTMPIASPKIVSIAPPASLTMQERIRLALGEGGFDLYVQRIAPLRDKERAERFEILLRMKDGDTLHTPQTFFAAAEASDLMPDLDHWVVRELMGTLRKRAATLRTTCWEFSVNIAAQTLLTDRFSEYVVAELKRSSIPAGLLVFEIAECDAIEHQYSLSILAKRLHNVGCRIALDNCRAGLRTFETVRKWPITCMKIDGSLVRNLLSNCRYESQVRAVAKMANDLGIETVAECVENERTRDKLLGMEIDYAQGFYLGRPTPLSTLFR